MNLMKMSSQHMAKNVHCQNKELSFPVRESALEKEEEEEAWLKRPGGVAGVCRT